MFMSDGSKQKRGGGLRNYTRPGRNKEHLNANYWPRVCWKIHLVHCFIINVIILLKLGPRGPVAAEVPVNDTLTFWSLCRSII